MRIDRLELRNFRRFSEAAIDLHPQFTLLVGENGAGKTTILDALTVAMGVWLHNPPSKSLLNSRRRLLPDEHRLEPIQIGDRTQFQDAPGGVAVKATGSIQGKDIEWEFAIPEGHRQTTTRNAEGALKLVREAYDQARAEVQPLLPIIAFYGAGRTWLPHRERSKKKPEVHRTASRWNAFYDCLNERIRIVDLDEWFKSEALEAVNRNGRFRPGFQAVRRAVLSCIPAASEMRYDGDRREIVISIDGVEQPLSNLSAGQYMMLALVADIAIKAVTQNSFLLPADELAPEDHPLPRVLRDTPGIIAIDELDVHLHPRWQRRVAGDLKKTFPSIQFVCTTHSPQIIGEVPADEVRVLEPSGANAPALSFGMDSNWILETLMKADEQDRTVKDELARAFDLIGERDLNGAEALIAGLRNRVGNSKSIQQAKSTIDRIRLLGK